MDAVVMDVSLGVEIKQDWVKKREVENTSE